MTRNLTTNDDLLVDGLLRLYVAACPEVEAGPNFMPGIWRKIEARRSFSFFFERFAKTAMAFSAALCLFLAVLNSIAMSSSTVPAPTYTDALAADHTAEKTYYTEAIRSIPPSDKIYEEYLH